MNRSLYTGISGLLGHQKKLDVVGNNIANASTVGFKRSRINLQESFAQTLRSASQPTEAVAGRVPMQVGLGTRVGSIDRIFEQGNLELTGNSTDLAIYGDGFFMVSDSSGSYYTRNGAFQLNALGALVTADGQTVLGLNADATGALPASSDLAGIQIDLNAISPAMATTEIVLSQNLDSQLTTSTGSLVAGNTAGVTSVTGTAANGIGGTWEVTVTGASATRSTFTGSNPALPGALTAATTLAELGVTDFGSIEISVDNGASQSIAGFDGEMTLSEFMSRVESLVTGVELSIEDGELVMARSSWGDGAVYNLDVSETDSNILQQLFGSSAFAANDGTASTLAASGVLTTSRGVVMDPVSLSLGEASLLTGQVTEITDLGGGGLSVVAANGLVEGSFSVETADTTHESSITVYDSLGAAHTLSMTFMRGETDNTWYWEATAPAPASGFTGNTGSILFSEEDGSLLAFNYDSGATGLSFDPGNGSLLNIQLNAGTPGLLDGLTQTAHATTSLAIEQDGRPMGELTGIDFLDDGTIQGVFSNGVSQTLAQVLVAEFNNPMGLSAVGGSLFSATSASGVAQVGVAGSEVQSLLKSGYLEQSNTDLTTEFTELILAQRGFQASAKVISTADALLDETIRLKR
jgi:flagellar hook protein FlgE